MAEQIKKFEKKQEVLSMKEQIDSRVKQRAEQIRNELQQEKEESTKTYRVSLFSDLVDNLVL